MVAAVEEVKGVAKQEEEQQLGEIVETHAAHLFVPQLPLNHVQRLQNWSQGSKSVDEYTEEFYKLLTRVDLSESDDQLVSRYIGGLRSQIQGTLNLFDTVNVSKAYQKVLLIEKTSA
jgi:hypothetical protein